jgi:hypothetical protein
VKLEYLYVDLGSSMVQMMDSANAGRSIDYRFQHHDNIVRFGVNYRIGG